MKKLLSLSFILVLCNTSKAQLYFKNVSSSPVYVAYAMKSWYIGDESWYSYGWWSVDPYQTVTISEAVGLNPNVYWFAVSQDGKYSWNGKNSVESILFLTAAGEFKIKNANLQYVKDKNPSYTWESFRHIEIAAELTEYTIEIN